MHDALTLPLLEVVASLMGIAGAALLATKSRFMHLAWPIWLVSNAGWLAFALLLGYHWLAMMQGAFAVVNVIGLLAWRAQKSDITQPAARSTATEQDRADAARYRWLAKHAYIGECFSEDDVILQVQGTDREVPLAGPVGAAIDAAIERELARAQGGAA